MSRRRNASHGPEAFERFYSTIYPDRWPDLRKSFSNPKQYLALSSTLPAAEPYYLDPGSALVALALDARPGRRTLDLCAAPGGKSLVLLRSLFPGDFPPAHKDSLAPLRDMLFESVDPLAPENAVQHAAPLFCNELSASRRRRLSLNLQSHISAENRFEVRAWDASRVGLLQPESWDRILADVPCSSEAHLVQNPMHLENWSEARTRSLAIRAGAIAAAAADALAPGGRMVYSTCAISPRENEELIAKILRKRQTLREVFLEKAPPWLETSAHGYYILPDRGPGWGPLFFSILQKDKQ